MGLDLVELVIKFEDAFGISIPDEAASEMRTPRHVADYVLTQVNLQENPTCLSQQAFYFLRQRLAPALSVARSDFRPDSRLENLVPLEGRRENWSNLQTQLGPSVLPNLVRPNWVFVVAALFPLTTLVIVQIYGRSTNFFFVALLAAIVVGYFVAWLTRPMKREFASDARCVGDLAKYVSIHSPHAFKRQWTREQVVQVVREIIIYETGVHDFHEDSDFIKDMHLD